MGWLVEREEQTPNWVLLNSVVIKARKPFLNEGGVNFVHGVSKGDGTVVRKLTRLNLNLADQQNYLGEWPGFGGKE